VHQHPEQVQVTKSKRARLMRLKLRLIDVEEARVVTIPNGAQYAALSYKWGTEGSAHQPRLTYENLGRLEQAGALDSPDACAQTIRDAMETCRKVGFRYLWVDALCIIQDSKQKTLHMRHMDAIYALASFTIVPADSSNASSGIHGISIPRVKPRDDHSDPFWCRYGVRSIAHCLARSPWAHRAWTYQEATLSRRLLVFTEHLCALICPNRMYREDGFWEPLWDVNQTDPLILLQFEPIFDQSLRDFSQWEQSLELYHAWVREGLQEKTLTCSPLKLYSTILSSYVKRDLTKPKDIYKALFGITTELELRMGPFWGSLPRLHVLEALTWQYDKVPRKRGELKQSGARYHPIERRNKMVKEEDALFPSWSCPSFKHCEDAVITLTSCAFEETRLKTSESPSRPEMVAVYVKDQNHGLLRLDRSSPDQPEFLHSELNDEDRVNVRRILDGLIVPPEYPLLIFKTVIISVDVAAHWFDERGGWAMFPIGDTDEKLKMRLGSLTMIHLNVEWRQARLDESKSDFLDIAVLGLYPVAEFGCMRMIAYVVSKTDGVYSREGLVEINVDPRKAHDEYVEWIFTQGQQELVILG
jgi:hypothetical protein